MVFAARNRRMWFSIVTLCLIFIPFISCLPQNANNKHNYKRQYDEAETQQYRQQQYQEDPENPEKISLVPERTGKPLIKAYKIAQPQPVQQQQYVQDERYSSTPIPILKFDKTQSLDGSYKSSYETGNNIIAEETGYIKNLGVKDQEALVQQGSYTYTAPDGTIITTSYTADEGGFRVEGSHLPTPPPIPEEIRKALETIFEGIRLQQEAEERDAKYGKNRPAPEETNSVSDNYPSYNN